MFLLEQVVNGLVLGGYYLLIALGLSLIFSVGGIVNLAHGAFYALGAYAVGRDREVLGFAPAVVLSPVAVGAARHPVRALHPAPLLHRRPDPQPARHLRLAMVAEQAIRIIWGAAPLSAAMPQALKGSVILGDFLFSRYRLLLLAWSRWCSPASGCCCTRPRSAAWCAPASSGPTWWRRSASGCSPT
jgi:branched-chain amino acid transport system permease protein